MMLRRGLASFACGGALAGGVVCAKRARCQPASPPRTPPAPAYTLQQQCAAEALGTGMIVTLGCGIPCAARYAGVPIGHFSIAAGFGLVVASAVYITRDVSGAHLNPAVTAALVATGRADAGVAAPFVAAQMAGATIGAALNYVTHRAGIRALEARQKVARGTAASVGVIEGCFGILPNRAMVRTPGTLAVEVGATAMLALSIFALTDPGNSVPEGAQPALIGTSVAVLIAQYGPISGAGMNPARDLGPRIVTALAGFGTKASFHPAWWAYTVGPIAGAVLGGLLYDACFTPS